MDAIYANKFTVTMTKNEVFLIFDCVKPLEDGTEELLESKTVVLTHAAFANFQELSSDLLKKAGEKE